MSPSPVIYHTAQDAEMPIQQAQVDTIHVRYAYARSHESQYSNQPGQDYLEFHLGGSSANKPKFVFAVCDGVGSSFMGNIAAQRVGECLCEELWGKWGKFIPASPNFGEHLSKRLRSLTDFVNQEVRDYKIGDDLPSLMRTALEKQKGYGTETMFVCGRLIGNSLALAWLGDVRLQLLTEDLTPVSGFEYVPDTNRRWSSREGIRGGGLQTFVINEPEALLSVKHILAFSDGLLSYEQHLPSMSSDDINSAIQQLAETPLSDDISFIQFTLDNN